MKQISIRLDDDLHRKLRVVVIERETSIQKVMESLLEEYVKEYENSKDKVIRIKRRL